jgi:Ca2+-binding RTX toxin-like protein
MATPTNENQLMLELINRARANPQAEADRLLSGNLNEGLAPGTISTDAKQPLAWNERLGDAATGHSQAMLDQDFFAHTNPNTNKTYFERIADAGYDASATGENIAWKGSSGSLNLAEITAEQHDQLFGDAGIPGRGHRKAILNNNYREIGISNLLGTNHLGYNHVVITTQKYGTQANSKPFLTGVVFTDEIVTDNFYTLGEGLGGATVNVFDSSESSLVGSTTTYSSGGYQLQLAAGTYDISVVADFDGDGVNEVALADNVVIGTANVKVDFTSAIAAELPTPTPNPDPTPDPAPDSDPVPPSNPDLTPGSTLEAALEQTSPADAPPPPALPHLTQAHEMPTFNGTGESGYTIAILNDSVLLGTTTVDESGRWSFTPDAPLLAGVYNVTFRSIDAAGNVSNASPPITFVVYGATDQNDVLHGMNTDDVISGLPGNDRIFGGGGHDILRGGDGNDRLVGGDGDDILIGGRGNNRMEGGAGADIFVIEQVVGLVRILDFNPVEDVIGLPNGQIRLGAIEVSLFRDNNTLLSIGETIIGGLAGITPTQLSRRHATSVDAAILEG